MEIEKMNINFGLKWEWITMTGIEKNLQMTRVGKFKGS